MTRQVMNQKSTKLFENFPCFGVGPGRYQSVYVPLDLPPVLAHRTENDFMRKGSHNSYLSFLAEGGVVGTLPLAALIVVLAIRGASAAMSLNRKGEQWALGVYASFISMSVHLWSLAGLTGTHAWFVYGLLAAIIFLTTRCRKDKASTAPRPQMALPRSSFATNRPDLIVGR